MSLETRWFQGAVETARTNRVDLRPSGWAALENGKDTTLMSIRVGVNILQFCSVSNSLSHANIANKVRYIFFKEVFARPLSLCRCDSFCMILHVCRWICIWVYNIINTQATCSNESPPPSEEVLNGLCPWCSRYRRRKGTRRHEFKSWMRLIAFHIALIPLGKVWIQLFSPSYG